MVPNPTLLRFYVFIVALLIVVDRVNAVIRLYQAYPSIPVHMTVTHTFKAVNASIPVTRSASLLAALRKKGEGLDLAVSTPDSLNVVFDMGLVPRLQVSVPTLLIPSSPFCAALFSHNF